MNLKTLGCSVWYTSDKAFGFLFLSLDILSFAPSIGLLWHVWLAVCYCIWFSACVRSCTIPLYISLLHQAQTSVLMSSVLISVCFIAFGPILGSTAFSYLSLWMFIFIYIYPLFDRRWLYKESQTEEEHNPHMKTCQSWAEGWEKTRGATESWLAPSNSHLKRECICVRPTFCQSCTAKMPASTKTCFRFFPLFRWPDKGKLVWIVSQGVKQGCES